MSIAASIAGFEEVAARNDAFALEHDIDAYYERSSALIRYVERRRLECIRDLLRPGPSERILEVGCGGGHVLRLFPHQQLTGVDVSQRMLDKARRNLQGYDVRLVQGELSQCCLPRADFGRIVCTEVLEHTVDPSAILQEIRNLLARNGRVVITFPNDRLIHQIKAVFRRTCLDRLSWMGRLSWGGDTYHLHVWSVPEMRALLRGFFNIERERMIPSRFLPIRCCFQCSVDVTVP